MWHSLILLFFLSFDSVFAQGNLRTATSAASTAAPKAPSTSNSDGQVKVHVVRVGANNAIKFEPNKLSAQVGDMVQFQFAGGNHTVAQSTFDQPCVPISMVDPKVTGFYSGYIPVSASTEMMPTYTVMINDVKPIWIYCAQGQHCQKGMTMVINENVQANASRSLENFSALAAKSVTVQMKLDGSPASGSTPSKPSSGTTQPSGSSSKSGDKGSSSGPSGLKEDDPSKSPAPISSSGRTSASVAVSALVGIVAFILIN